MDFTKQASEAETSTHQLDIMHSPKWLRVYFGGQFIADSRNVLLVSKDRRPPIYYFPKWDVHLEYLQEDRKARHLNGLGKVSFWNVKVGERAAEHAAWSIEEPSAEAAELVGTVAFKWDAMDAWFEEDEQVYVHARDPRVRIDVIQSSRHVRVEIGGLTVAETRRPVLLFETGLVTRYYIPRMDVRIDLLEPSDTHTECPYKGVASYHSVRVADKVYKDIVWYYPFPHAEVGKIQNLVAFYNEKVDLYVDGEKQ